MKVLIAVIFILLIISVKADFGVPVTVSVNPIYTLSLDIETVSENVLPSENLTILIELSKSGKEGEITVNLDYEITKRKNKIAFGNAGNINISDHIAKNITIQIPSDIKQGKHDIKITAFHPQAIGDSDEDKFFVRRNVRFSFFSFIFDILNLF